MTAASSTYLTTAELDRRLTTGCKYRLTGGPATRDALWVLFMARVDLSAGRMRPEVLRNRFCLWIHGLHATVAAAYRWDWKVLSDVCLTPTYVDSRVLCSALGRAVLDTDMCPVPSQIAPVRTVRDGAVYLIYAGP